MNIDNIPNEYSRFIPLYLILGDIDGSFSEWKEIINGDSMYFTILVQNRDTKHAYTYCLLYGIMIMGLYNE